VTVDGTPVALVERVDAVHRHGKEGKKRAAAAAWQVHLMNAVGHAQLRDPTYLARLVTLALPRASLLTVDLSPFPALQALDLSANQLTKVDGLDTPAPTLRLLNLSGNRSLDLKAVLAPLSKHSASLQHLSLCLLDDPKHARAPTAKPYRLAVLRALLVRNRGLNWLDGQFIAVPERGEALRSVFGRRRDAALQRYLFAAAVAYDVTVAGVGTSGSRRAEPRLHPEDVNIVTQSQYEPSSVRTLNNLSGHSLVTAAIDLTLFTSLTLLNLSHNAITDLLPLGLRALSSLIVLDVHDNKVDCSLEEVATVIDSLPALECIAIRDNPVMDKPGQAAARLGLLRALGDRKSTAAVRLRVIDTEVSVRDRLDCWATEGAAAADNALRLATVEALRLPKAVAKDSLRVLDFAEAGLTSLDLGEYRALEVVLLSGNSLQALTADLLQPPRTLRVLDVRDNALISLTDTAAFLSTKTPLVESLGLSGNPFAKETIRPHRSVRTALLAALPRERLRLRSVDDVAIGADELLAAWSRGEDKGATKLVRFEVVLAARAGGVSVRDLTEVDVSGCSLTVVALADLVSVRRLSLARNDLRTLVDSGIDRCTELRALDLAHNRLESASSTAASLGPLTSLRVLFMHANPCHSSDVSGRVRLLGKFYTAAGATPGTLPLENLDGEEVTIREKCAAASLCGDRRFDAPTVARWRLRLALRDQGVLSLASMTSLDVSAVGFTSLAPLAALPNLTALNVADNRLTLIETPVWKTIGAKLLVFDLRRNNLPSLRSVVGALVDCCPCLRDVYLAQATRRTKETASRSETAKRVCAVIRYLRSVDGVLNPYGTLSVGGVLGGGAGEVQEPPSRLDLQQRAQQEAARGGDRSSGDAFASADPSAPPAASGTMKLARVPSSMVVFSKEGDEAGATSPRSSSDAKYGLLFAEEDPSAYVNLPSGST
jgi:Leucine-rich repeat (LRR) protein